jgi:carboxymethylenebutenolidase
MSWNAYRTDAEGGITAANIVISGGGGDPIHAYVARPDGAGPYSGIVLTHHPTGADEFHRELARRFAEHGFIAICPNLFERYGHGTVDDVAARVRGEGGLADASAIADAEAAMKWLKAQPSSNGKVGVIGPCAGGRLALVVASSVPGFDAVVDLWGGNVVMSQDRLTAKQPVAPIDLTPNLSAPLLGLFGNDDLGPSPAQVDQHEEALKANGKTYQFHRYDGASHGFFYYTGMSYRPQAAMDGWDKVEAWFKQYLA